MIYEENLQFINKFIPSLYNTISTEESLYNLSIKRLDDKFNYIMENEDASCFVHSIYDIDDEMKMMFKSVEKDCKTIILFGLGCGYALKYIQKNYPDLNNLCIIEPTLHLFNEYLKESKINDAIKSAQNTTFIINQEPEKVADMLLHIILKDPKASISFNVSYRTIFNDYFIELQTLLLRKIRTTISTMATLRSNNEKWISNSFKNLQLFKLSIESIISDIKDKPVVIVSAGPSLGKNIHLIEAVKRKAIVFAVGSAIKILDNYGIEPHYRVAIDGDIAETKVFTDLKNNTIPLIYSNTLYYEILRDYKGPIISMITQIDFLGSYFYDKVRKYFIGIDTGASVANATFDLLCQSGCKKIVFIGQDMCFQDGKIHAKGTIDSKNQSQYNEKSHIKMEDIYGNSVSTISAYLQIKYDLDSKIKNYQDIQVINATEGGLGIEGAKNKPLGLVLEEDLIDNIKFDSDGLYQNELAKIQSEYDLGICSIIEDMKKEIEEIISVNNEKSKLVEVIKKKRKKEYKQVRILDDLEYVKKLDSQLENNDFYNKVVKTALHSVFIKIKYRYTYNEHIELSQDVALESEITDRIYEINKYINNFYHLLDRNDSNV